MKMMPRSYLFVPATRIDRVIKALDSQADAVIIDLEDTVNADKKSEMREALLAFFTNADPQQVNPNAKPIWLRINNVGYENCGYESENISDNKVADKHHKVDNFQQDLQLCQSLLQRASDSGDNCGNADKAKQNRLQLSGIVLPKVENGESIEHVHQATGLPVIIQIETATAIANLQAIISKAKIKGLYAISYGKLDLCHQLNIAMHSQAEQDFCKQLRYQLLILSKAKGLYPPIESIYPNIKDKEGLVETASYASDFGFSAMFAIHPHQLDAIHQAFAPTQAQLEFAQQVMAKYQKTQSYVFCVDGVMVDLPLIKQCQRVLECG